jgi:hypothetical protein
MMNKIEVFDKSNVIGLVSVIPDQLDHVEVLGALDLNLLEKLIKEIKKRDPCKRGETRKYKFCIRKNVNNDYKPDTVIGDILLFQRHVSICDEIKPEEKNVYYAIAPILVDKESVKE